MTIFDVILPIMKVKLRSDLNKGNSIANNLADKLDRKGYHLCPICRKGIIKKWNPTPEGSEIKWSCGHRTLE